MHKRRQLQSGQDVIIIFTTQLGFVEKSGTFKQYRKIQVDNTQHHIPFFSVENKELSGIECFWVLPTDIAGPDDIVKMQRKIIPLQITALEISHAKGYTLPTKVKDKEIKRMAHENIDRMNTLIQKLGFDPRDESWIEHDLALSNREKNWFAFERENGLMFSQNWDDIIAVYNNQYGDHVSVEEAKHLSKKRMRYILGSYSVRISGNSNKSDWKQSAKEFEQHHRGIENRLLDWIHERAAKFPIVRTKESVRFWPGPYFHECIEKIPQLFTDTNCSYIKKGIVLRVVAYDVQTNYIRLDFTEDNATLIKGHKTEKPWIKDEADYDIWVMPDEIEKKLEILESLT